MTKQVFRILNTGLCPTCQYHNFDCQCPNQFSARASPDRNEMDYTCLDCDFEWEEGDYTSDEMTNPGFICPDCNSRNVLAEMKGQR